MSDNIAIKKELCEKFKKLNDESLLKLTDEEKNSICRNLSSSQFNPYSDTQCFIKDALFRSTKIPERILRKLITFRMSKNDDGVLLIEGLPDEPILPSTPTTPNEKASKTTFVSEEILAMFGLFLGEPFGYAEEKNGALFQDIFPTRQGKQLQSNESSEVDLKLHSEDAPEKYRPDYVLLYCIKSNSEDDAVTFISLAKNITDKLTDCEFEQLKKKRFYPKKLPSFGGNKNSEKLEPCAVIEGSKASPSIRYDCFMNGDTDMDNKLLEMIDKFGELVKKPIKLKSGSLLIIDNNRSLHSRSKFTAKLQGEDRLLQRLNVKKDLRIAREYIPPDSQIIRML